MANSGGSNSISATAEGAGTETLAITGNKLYQYDDFAGIYYIDREGSPTLNLTITGNTLADPAGNATNGGAWGIYGEAGAATGDAGKVCAAITGNSLTGSGQTSLGSSDIELDQNIAGVTYELPGYTGGSTDTNAVATFVAGNNNSGGTPSVIATVIGAPGFVGGSSCPAP